MTNPPSISDLPATLLIAIETSGPVGSIAAALDGQQVAEESFERGMRHGRELVPRLASMCSRISRPPGTIDVVAVSAGPGSYTGVRVGVTCAKSLAFATRWIGGPALKPDARVGGPHQSASPFPSRRTGEEGEETRWPPGKRPGAALVAVHTLEVLAQNADPDAGRVAVVGDARRGQVYAAFFERVGQELARRSDDLVLDPDELWARLEPGTLIVGDAVVRCPEVLRASPGGGPEGVRLGGPATALAHARHVARLGWRNFCAGRSVSAHDLTPIYLRRPEAVDRLLTRQRRRGRTER